MPYAPLLTEPEIAEGLRQLPDWRREGASLIRKVECASFRAAIALVNRAADAAEEANHHPDIVINWRIVTFTLTTKAVHGLTWRDLDMGRRIDALVEGP